MSLYFGNSNEYLALFIHTLSAVGMNGVYRKWFMSQKYWYTRAQGLEKEKQETTKLHNRLSENVCQKKRKSLPKRNPSGCIFVGANSCHSAVSVCGDPNLCQLRFHPFTLGICAIIGFHEKYKVPGRGCCS